MTDRSYGRPRTKSRTKSFIEAVEAGSFRDAVDAIRPGGPGSGKHSGHRSRHRHHHHRDDYDHDYDYDSDPDDYYHSEERKPRRGSYYFEESRPRHGEDYYYEEERPLRRGRSAHEKSKHYYYSDDDSDYDSRDIDRVRTRDRRPERPMRRYSSSGGHWSQAAKAAVAAGMIEGFKSRNHRDRTQRIATAAVGAAVTDAFIGGGDGDRKGKRHVAESAIAGLALDRIANGTTHKR